MKSQKRRFSPTLFSTFTHFLYLWSVLFSRYFWFSLLVRFLVWPSHRLHDRTTNGNRDRGGRTLTKPGRVFHCVVKWRDPLFSSRVVLSVNENPQYITFPCKNPNRITLLGRNFAQLYKFHYITFSKVQLQGEQRLVLFCGFRGLCKLRGLESFQIFVISKETPPLSLESSETQNFL